MNYLLLVLTIIQTSAFGKEIQELNPSYSFPVRLFDILFVYDHAFIRNYIKPNGIFNTQRFKVNLDTSIGKVRSLFDKVAVTFNSHVALMFDDKIGRNSNKVEILEKFMVESKNYEKKSVYDLRILISGLDYYNIELKDDLVYPPVPSERPECNSHITIYKNYSLGSLIVKAILLRIGTKYDNDHPECSSCHDCVMARGVAYVHSISVCTRRHLLSFSSQIPIKHNFCGSSTLQSSFSMPVCRDHIAIGEEECDCEENDTVEKRENYCDLRTCKFIMQFELAYYEPPAAPHNPVLLWSGLISVPICVMSIFYGFRSPGITKSSVSERRSAID